MINEFGEIQLNEFAQNDFIVLLLKGNISTEF